MARARKNIEELKKAAEANDSKLIYSALRKDLIDKMSSFSENKDYLQSALMIMRLQSLIDKSGFSEEDGFEVEANAVVEAALEKISEMEEKYYEEYLGDDDE